MVQICPALLTKVTQKAAVTTLTQTKVTFRHNPSFSNYRVLSRISYPCRAHLAQYNMDPRVLPTPRIPYDILISIIDELAWRDEFEDLSACSQTCRMLLHPCRVHLFSAVTISTNAPQFSALLNRNPTIQVYIQELTYEPIAGALSKDIADAFLLLSNLKTLVLQGYAYYPDDWGALTPYIQHVLIHLFSSPSVTRIMVDGFSNLPAILLSSCSNLKHLEIDHYTSFTSEACNTTVLAPPKLVSLNVAKARRPIVESLLNETRADGLPLLDLCGLRSLTIRMMHGPAEERHLTQILRSTPKLEHLCFTVPYSAMIPDGMFQTLTLLLPTLRSLKMEWQIDDNGISEKFPGLVKALQMLAHHPNDLNEFNLILWTPWSHTLAAQDWERIDQFLADRSAFRQLKKLSIKLRHKLDVSQEAEEKRILAEFRVEKLLRLSLASDDYLDFQFTLDDTPRWIP